MATPNVHDALEYLDLVKVQFADHPDVYNRFLDIMKDCQSQSIDTPVVIERVATLFRGHPSLIQGFNTFLPSGYFIECPSDPTESDLITVTTPTGTTQTPGGIGIAGAMNRMAQNAAGANAQTDSAGFRQEGGYPRSQTGHLGPGQAHAQQPGGHLHQPRAQSPLAGTPIGSQGPGTPGATAGAGVLTHGPRGSGAPASHDPKRPHVEFNHAFHYVNKIKQRFAGNPDTYKQFLEILQTYQKEQKPIHDVYAQVAILFDNAKDLLDEFKQFLPDTSMNGGVQQGGLIGVLGQVTSGMGSGSVSASGMPSGAQAPPVDGSKKLSGSRKKRAAGTTESAPKGATSKPKKSKHHHKNEMSPPRDIQPGSPMYAQQMYAQGMLGPDGVSIAIGPNGLPLGPVQAPLASLDEVAFFDRVKKHIDDRGTYLEFLKLLNLFTQDIIDVRTLVDRAALFIGGHTELFATFKSLCNYDMTTYGWLENDDPHIDNVPAAQRDRVDLSTCKAYGPSYRKLPPSEINLACSGRDAMCWEVLNDTWVSHPTWASEGEAFNPHKKNIYEDALYRSEEERHEYDYHIEANLRTIALLEPIAARIAIMDNDERATFRLKAGLGGQSRSIYQRVIKKVYGREHGAEVIAALHDNPCVAVPVVLARLKQKDEEWKRAQREWNKVWREVDARNYYKSLDHQGVNFKAADRKAITAKSLVAEIEAARVQQQQRRLAVDPSLPRFQTSHQLAYTIEDSATLADVLKLAFSFLDRANYSKADAERIENFLRTIVPLLFDEDAGRWEDILTEEQADEDAESRDDGSEGATTDDDGETSQSRRKGGPRADLRRQLLKSQAQAQPATSVPAIVQQVTNAAEGISEQTAVTAASSAGDGTALPAEDVEMADSNGVAHSAPAAFEATEQPSANAATAPAHAETTWIHSDPTSAFDSATGQRISLTGPHSAHKSSRGSASDRRHANFFCNTHFFVFVRLLQLLYSRLHKMRTLSAEMAAATPLRTRMNPVAVELGLQDGSTGPAAVVGAAAASLAPSPSSEPILTSGLHLHPSRYYDTLLDLTEKLLDSELDQSMYEESIRYMYGIEGYTAFTLDKVVSALVKTAQVITTDSKSQELLAILERDRARSPSPSQDGYRAAIASRMAAEAVIGKEENMFRIEWISNTRSLLIQMLSRDDLTLDETRSKEQQWRYYIESYCLWMPTEGLVNEAQAPFLKRNLRDIEERRNEPEGTTYTTNSGLEIRVCIRTYHLFFVQETEDVFARHLPVEAGVTAVEAEEKADARRNAASKAKGEKFNEWVEKRRAEIDAPSEGAAEVEAPAGKAPEDEPMEGIEVEVAKVAEEEAQPPIAAERAPAEVPAPALAAEEPKEAPAAEQSAAAPPTEGTAL